MKGKAGIIAIGLLGVIVLSGLCVWQVQRLAWKETLIDRLEARLAAPPTMLTDELDPETQEFSRVTIAGRFDQSPGAEGFVDAPFLTTQRPYGAVYRIIQPFETTTGRRILVDRGVVPVAEKNDDGKAIRPTPSPEGVVEITGALRWPEEGGEGPDHGARDNVWIERDLDEMSAIFGADAVLVVAETSTAVGDWPVPSPIEAVNVRNNHLEYALTWAALAVVWAAMTAYLAFFRRGP